MSAPAGAGIRHLRALAVEPRPAGSAAESRARAYAADVLRRSGFIVAEREFGYSALAGTYGLSLIGVLGTLTMLATLIAPRFGAEPWMPYVIGIGATALASNYLRPPRSFTGGLMRRRARNLVARRDERVPEVWLVAHLDTKSQPIPSAVRAVCSALFVLMLVTTFIVATSFGETAWADHRMVMRGLVLLVLAAGVPLACCVTGFRSDGALDNASGAAAVLAAAEQLDPQKAVGVLLSSAEELAMAGAEAWVNALGSGVALNCDGVDDVGQLTIMHNGAPTSRMLGALRAAAGDDVRIMRMPFGMLTDSTVLQRAGWDAVTVSHGSLATLARIHRPADSLANLQGTSIDGVARVLARAAEELA